jgi:hypothetical protein
MNCKTVRSCVQEYLEGRLPTLERNEFVHHVSECAACEDEVLAYREIFGGLRSLERVEAPPRVSRAVLAHLRADGRIYETPVPVVSRILERFFSLPALLRYPLAASLLIAILYVPLAALLGVMRGSVTSATDVVTNLYTTVHGALSGVSAFATFFDALESYARAFSAVRGAATAFAAAAGENLLLVVVGLLVVCTGVVAATIIARRKRGSHHATFSF